MKQFKAWIIIDNKTGEPFLTEASPHIFWVYPIAKRFCKHYKWTILSIKRILITEVK